jgi:ParB-like chromosome segregation protein Spo0J
MKTPITVRQVDDGIHLVAGLHRLEAAKALGWEWIDAAFFEGDVTDAAIWQLLENLDHLGLTALERAEETAELIRLTAQRISRQNVGKKRGRPQSITAKAARRLPIGGNTQDAREKTAERAFKIADLSPEAKAEAMTCGLDDNQSALLEVANESTPKTQIAKLREIKGRAAKEQAERNDVKKRVTVKVDAEKAAPRPEQRHPDDVAARRKRQSKRKTVIANAPPTAQTEIPPPGSAPAHPPEDAAESPVRSAPADDLEIPAMFDRRPLSTQNKVALAHVMAEWDQAKGLKTALTKGSDVVRERFLAEVRRWLNSLRAQPAAGLH